MGKKKPTREDIIRAFKELDVESEKPVGAKALARKGISPHWAWELFPEGLTELKRKHGIRISPQEQVRSDDELLEEIDKVVSKLKCLPSWVQLRRETGISDKTFLNRFAKETGRKPELFISYRKWLEKQKPKSKNIKLVNELLESQGKTKTPRSRPAKRKAAKRMKWPKGSGKVYGAPLNFGSLIYEPVNEQGVVFLFGMVSKRLGFSIENIQTEFPDCEAKRYIEGKGKRQQQVRIEFEFRSRDYDHPIEGCEVIVCWEDNWGSDCPLEVIELREEIKHLMEYPEFSRK